jgi:hypothetical protein
MIQFRVWIIKNFAASKILKRFYASGFIVCSTEKYQSGSPQVKWSLG